MGDWQVDEIFEVLWGDKIFYSSAHRPLRAQLWGTHINAGTHGGGHTGYREGVHRPTGKAREGKARQWWSEGSGPLPQGRIYIE